MKYNIGDMIRVVSEFDYDDPMGVTASMERLKGKAGKIVDVYKHRNFDIYVYNLDIDDKMWGWTETMINPLAINKGKGE